MPKYKLNVKTNPVFLRTVALCCYLSAAAVAVVGAQAPFIVLSFKP